MTGFERVASQANIAGSLINYDFIYPQKSFQGFYISFEPSVSFETVDVFFDSVFPSANIRPVHVYPPNSELPTGRNYFEITNLIDPFIRTKLWSSEVVPGPNCYQTALASSGFYEFAGRYVHDTEFSYRLTRDFKKVDARSALPGSIVVYLNSGAPRMSSFAASSFVFAARAAGVLCRDHDAIGDIPEAIGESRYHALRGGLLAGGKRRKSPSEVGFAPSSQVISGYDHGEHAAILLTSGLVFQKGCFGDFCPYRIVPVDKAMSSIEMKAANRFEPTPEPERDENFRIEYYSPLAAGEHKDFGFNESLNEKVKAYLPLIKYYAGRLRASKDLSWADYKKGRMELLTSENMWEVTRQIDRELSVESSEDSALLRIDRAVAEMYLEMVSLDWQNQAMAVKFWPFSDRWTDARFQEELKTLYREKYMDVQGDNFKREVEAHLAFRGVPRERWDSIVEKMRAKVGAYNVEELAPSNGADRIPFFDILDEAVKD